MHEACPSVVPKPLAHGNFARTIGCFLVTEFLERDDTSLPPTGMSLAQKLVQLHTTPTFIPEGFTSPVFGFPVVTYCGPTPQPISFGTSWHDFFVEHRMRMILQACEVNQGHDQELKYWVERVISGPVRHLLADGHLGGSMGVVPALMHGNLWSGNSMRGTVWGDAESGDVVFDPSSSWCHNEFEMGIVTLFGGFSSNLFQEYHDLLPKDRACGRVSRPD